MELVYTDAAFERQGVIRDFALDMAYGDSENDFQLTMPLPKSVRHGADREAVTSDLSGVGSITIEAANGSQLAGIEVHGKAERVVGKNLFDEQTEAGALSSTDGSNTADSSRLRSKNFTPVLPNTYYNHVTSASGTYIYWYDSSKAFIKRDDSLSQSRKLSPSNAAYMRLMFYSSYGTTYKNDVAFMATSDSVTYEPYHQPYVEVVEGRNLFSGFEAVGKIINGSGSIVDSSVAGYSHAIHVNPGDKLTLSGTNTYEGDSYTIRIHAFSGTGTNTWVKQIAAPSTSAGTYYAYTFTVPDNANYVRFNYTFNSTDIQIERGTTATPYVPYGALEAVVSGKNLLKAPASIGKTLNQIGGAVLTSAPIELTKGTYNISIHMSDSTFIDDFMSAVVTIGYDDGTSGTVRYSVWSDMLKYPDRVGLELSIGTKKVTSLSVSVSDYSTASSATIAGVQVAAGGDWSDYEPYTEVRTAIDTQGNPLASLPDGTRDELTVDASGRVQLVKRVYEGRVTKSVGQIDSTGKLVRIVADSAIKTLKDAFTADVGVSNYGNLGSLRDARAGAYSLCSFNQVIFMALDGKTVAEVDAMLQATPLVFYVERETPEIIDLGTIELPHTMDGYTRITLDATMAAPFTVRYVEFPATHSYVVEVVPELEVGALVYEHGTDIGGIVDTKGFDNTGDVPVMTYSGRTWHGIMDASITRPDSGQPHLVLTGDINAAIATLIDRSGLGGVFSAAPAAGVAISYTVPRYVSMWDAIRGLCKQYGMRPLIERGNDKTVLGAATKQDYSNGAVSDLSMGLQFERFHRPVNHLVLLGQGELAGRTVIDIYADPEGNVSTTQTLFGADEVTDVYENTSESDAGKLLNDGIEKLRDMQKFASVGMSLPSNEGFQIGDTVTAYSVETGLVAAAEVVKKVVTVGDNGFAVTDYELGEPAVKAYK